MLPKKIIFLLLVLILAPLFFFTKSFVNAQNFNNVSILLARSAPSTFTTALICATTPSLDNGTENNVRITFPTSFSVSTNNANWTVSTASIPADSTAWPGIGTATGVSGKTVTFPSSDLSTSTKYCFRTLNSDSLQTASTSGSHKGNITTYQTNSTIDSSGFGLNVNSDQISINGVVPANPTDFEAEMELTNPTGDNFAQDTTLTYTLTYGSNLASPSNITVEAEWSLGTISGSGTPTVEILDYVIGSASDGYNSTPPVVDLINRKITWTINSFPAATTGETVTFQLKTNDSYTGAETVSFDVSGRVIGPGTQTPDSTVTKNYLYAITITPAPTSSPTPTSGPPSTTGTTPTVTPSTTTSPLLLQFEDLDIESVEIRGISPTTADIFVGLNKNAGITLNYGTSINNLNNSISSLKNSTNHLVLLKNLSPNARYYYRITASNASESIESEMFTFLTSSSESEVIMLTKTFVVISNNLLIYAQRLVDSRKIAPLVILPTGSIFTFSIAIENSSQIKSIQGFLRNKFILAVDSKSTQNYQNTSLIQTSTGEYSGLLASGTNPNDYELFLRVSDTSGNIYEQKPADFRIVKPLTVLEEGTGKPIEGAVIKIHSYNLTTQIYEELNESNLPIKNPERTLPDGTTEIILPQGKYKAEISSFLHEKKTVEFVLGLESDEAYPTVFLKKQPFSLMTFGLYLYESLLDYYNLTSEFIKNLSKSARLFELISFIIIALFTFTTFISLLFRTRNTPKTMIHYLNHMLKHRWSKSNKPIKGLIKDSFNKPLPKAIVMLLKGGDVIFQTSTNINGMFFTNGRDFDSIEVGKTGFQNSVFPFNSQIDEKTPVFHLKNHENYTRSTLHFIFETIKFIIGLFFEILMVLLFLMEILFIPTLGIFKVLPFIVITIIMFVIFIHHNVINRGKFL